MTPRGRYLVRAVLSVGVEFLGLLATFALAAAVIGAAWCIWDLI